MEHNLIQNPQMISRLAQLVDIKQYHLTPTLAENVQPVIIVGDARSDDGPVAVPAATVRRASVSTWGSVGANTDTGFFLYNPVAYAPRILRVRKIQVRSDSAAPVRFIIGWKLSAPPGAPILNAAGYPDGVSSNPPGLARFLPGIYISSGATGTQWFDVMLCNAYVSNAQPLTWEEPRFVVPASTTVLVMQSFGMTVAAGFAITMDIDEELP